jgi:hypothetical protein
MPTLKRVLAASPPSRKSPPAGDIRRNDDDDDDDDDGGDDRFSQPPPDDGGGTTRNIAAAPPLLSIARAIENRRGERAGSLFPRNVDDEDLRDDGGDATSDVVAVILSATTGSGGGGGGDYDVSSPRIRFLVGDGSLPGGRCARVVVAAASSGAASALSGLRPGDVVRWNRLEVRRVYDDCDDGGAAAATTTTTTATTTTTSSGPGRRNGAGAGARDGGSSCRRGDGASNDDDDNYRQRHRPSLTVACDMSTSWRDPEAGPAFARLCRIVVPAAAAAAAAGSFARDRTATDRMPTMTTTTTTTTTEEERFGRRDRRRDDDDDDCFDLVWEGVVPPSMETPRNVVVGLARWYRANARPHYLKVRGIEIFPSCPHISFLPYDGLSSNSLLPRIFISVGYSRAVASLPLPRRRTGRADGASCAKSPRPTCSVTWW